MIRACNVTKIYNKAIIKNFNYEFDRGLYLVVGESGCGKTTLLNILSKRDKKIKGLVQCNENILYIKDRHNLVSELTVKDHVLLFQKANNIKFNYYFNVKKLLNKKVKKLSLGERQLFILNLVFNSIEKTIILDEPLSALSIENLKIASKMLEKISFNKTVIISTHNKDYFNNYKEIKLTGKKKYPKTDNKPIINSEKKKNFKFYYWYIYIKKNIFKKIFFICSLFFSVFNYFYLNDYLDEGFNSYLSYFDKDEGMIIGRNISFTTIDEHKFYEVVKELSNYVVDYNANYYNSFLYNKNVEVGDYYIDNGLIFSSVKYAEKNLKDNEVIMGINYSKFCVNNNISNCDESYIKTLLINKKINDFNYTIKDIFYSEDNFVVSNKRFFKIYKENEYIEYYLDVSKEDKNNMFETINSSKYLTNFNFILTGENESYLRYKVDIGKYFNENIEYDDYLVCLEKGYNCLNYLNNFETLISIDEFVEIESLKLKNYKGYLEDGEIVISSKLSEILKKECLEKISFNFKYNNSIIEISLIIKDIVEEEGYFVYQNSDWSYKLFSEKLGFEQEDLRIKNIVIFENLKEGYYESENLYNEMIDDFQSVLSKMKKKLFLINICLSAINIMILIVLEIFQNKFKKEYYRYLNILNIEVKYFTK